MLSVLNYITWNVSPWLFVGEHFAIGWYGTLVTIGFVSLFLVLFTTLKYDNVAVQYTYITFATTLVFGLFFAHWVDCIFYNWEYTQETLWDYGGITCHFYNYFLQHPIRLLSLTHGGFASHGLYAAVLVVSVLLAKWFDCAKWYLSDRIFIGIWLLGVFVRIGNLLSEEILGKATSLPWGICYAGNELPLHPTQVYEALIFLSAFILGLYLFCKKDAGKYNGLITGITLVYASVLRLIVECFKQPQFALESDWIFNMGQLLSIPLLIVGGIMWYRAIKQGKLNNLCPKNAFTRAEKRRLKK